MFISEIPSPGIKQLPLILKVSPRTDACQVPTAQDAAQMIANIEPPPCVSSIKTDPLQDGTPEQKSPQVEKKKTSKKSSSKKSKKHKARHRPDSSPPPVPTAPPPLQVHSITTN